MNNMRKKMQFSITVNNDMLWGVSSLFGQMGEADEALLRAYVNDILRRYCQKLTNAGKKSKEAYKNASG